LGLFDNKLKAISDNNNNMWGTTFCDRSCISPDDIMHFSKNVIISSKDFENEIEVEVQLKQKFGNNINTYRLY
jgi:hypothetical protein